MNTNKLLSSSHQDWSRYNGDVIIWVNIGVDEDFTVEFRLRLEDDYVIFWAGSRFERDVVIWVMSSMDDDVTIWIESCLKGSKIIILER